MAHNTPASVQSLVIYQVYPRAYGATGKLADVTEDLDRIKALGVDVLYLLPVHPIGQVERKGSLGSPFAIADFRAINPELGTDADFDALVDAAHAAGLKIMMDVVFNHTAPDSVLVTEHPEFYHRDDQGRPVTSVPQWADIIDLAHPLPALTRYLIDTLAFWVRRGVDGFRCDAAALFPVEFWAQARDELAEIKPDLLWLAETIHVSMVEDRRRYGHYAASDAEMYAAFDMEYVYDLWPIWQSAVRGHVPVGRFLEMVRWQQSSVPGSAEKLRYVENHDNFRIMAFARSRDQALAWTALTAFLRGPFMIYAGQEAGAATWPTLFEREPVDWGDYALADFTTSLARLKKHPALRAGVFSVLADEPTVQLAWGALRRSGDGDRLQPIQGSGPGLYGVFNVDGSTGEVEVQLPDGHYRDLIGGGSVAVSGGRIETPAATLILEFQEPFDVRPWTTPLIDVFMHVEADPNL